MLLFATFAAGVLVSVATGLVAREVWRWRARRNYLLAAGWRERALRAEAIVESRGVLEDVRAEAGAWHAERARRGHRDGGAHAPQAGTGARR